MTVCMYVCLYIYVQLVWDTYMYMYMYMYVSMYTVSMGQKNSLHMVDPATWSTRSAQLHTACGKKISLSEDGSIALRRDASKQHKDGLVHTAWPVAVGRIFQVLYIVYVCM